MTALQHKLLRTIRTTLGQFLALVMIVVGGVAVYYGMNTAVNRLVEAQQSYYDEARFADYYFNVVRAPAGIVNQVQDVPGVIAATGRIQKDIKVVRDDGTYDTGRLTSYGPHTEINRLKLTEGRLFDANNASGDAEVLIDSQYALVWGYKNGSALDAIVSGRRLSFKVIGTAGSPEFMFKIKNPLEFPDFDTMVVIMMSQQQAEKVLGMPGEVNQVLVKIAPGASQSEIKESVEAILAPYGVTSSYPRHDQASHKYIQSQVDSLILAAKLMPPGFFAVAMMVQFVLLRRLIKSQRLQIGVLKALGYENHAIMIMFTGYSLAITTSGILLGLPAGTALAGSVSDLLGQMLELTVASSGINWPILLNVMVITTAVGLASGILASWEVMRINPVEAFHNEVPSANSRTLFEQWSYLWENTNSSWKMSLRSISRNRGRFGSTIMGIAVTASLILVAIYFIDSRDFLLTSYFTRQNNYDYIARFDKPVKSGSIFSWTGWTDIKAIEPALELPVIMKRPDAEGLYGEQMDELLVGINSSGKLRKVFDENEQQLGIPEQGILLSSRVAKSLGLKVGDQVLVETKPGLGPVHSINLLVRGIDFENIGSTSFASLEQANQIIGEEGLINAAMIVSSNPNWDQLEKRLMEIPGVDSIMRQDKQKANAMRLMSAMNYFTSCMIIFAIFIGAAIVYNNSIMVFYERRRELASLKVIGWSNKNISSMLFNEIILATILGLIIGLPLGKYLGGKYLQAISTETFTWPVVLYLSSYAISVLVTAVFALAGHLLAVRRVKELDMVEVFKDRD